MVLDGLVGITQQKYNGISGVVVTCLDTDAKRHSVRLNAPFSGKRLMVHPLNLVVSGGGGGGGVDNEDNEDSDDEDMNGVGGGNTGNNNGGNGNENQTDKVVRYCRTLGIDPVVLGLASATPLRRLQKEGERKDQEDENQDKNQDEDEGDPEGDPFLYGFGLAGRDPIERLRSALRAATRVPPSLLFVVVVVVLVLVVVVVAVVVVVVVAVVVMVVAVVRHKQRRHDFQRVTSP